jgi:hypothetical protein
MAVRSVVGWIMMGSFWWLLRNGPDYVASFLVFGQLMTWKEVVSLSYKVTKEIKLWGFRTLNWLAKRDLNPNSQVLDVCGFLLVLLHTDIEGLASLGWLRDRK